MSDNIPEQEYMVYFDFTTVKGNRFTQRSGKLDCTTEMTLEELKNDQEDLKKACAQFIHSKYPKWNIFMITIKNIEPCQKINATPTAPVEKELWGLM